MVMEMIAMMIPDKLWNSNHDIEGNSELVTWAAFKFLEMYAIIAAVIEIHGI